MPEARGSGQEELPHVQGAAAVRAQEGREELPLARGQGRRPGGTTPCLKRGAVVSARGNGSKGRSSNGRHRWCTHQVAGSITEFHILETDPIEVYSAIPFPTGVLQFH